MNKTLEVGKNYADIFGLSDGKEMIYNGGVSWTAKDGDRQMTMDSQETTNNAIDYVNKPSKSMGSF